MKRSPCRSAQRCCASVAQSDHRIKQAEKYILKRTVHPRIGGVGIQWNYCPFSWVYVYTVVSRCVCLYVQKMYHTHWDKTFDEYIWIANGFFFSFVSTLCYISYPTDYFPPSPLSLSENCRTRLMFWEVFWSSLKEKMFRHKGFHFFLPRKSKVQEVWRAFNPVGNQARDGISKYEFKLSVFKIQS